ncbi:hypothetical protein P8452_74465 [Trifolium repens]|nr:putative calcium-binding protein CML25 [Trifolium repens]WJX92882.1 hypothetical protein P8452_74465 [Trifolium repens]
MFQHFTSCFTFLHNTKSLFNKPRKRRPNNRFSSISDISISSFIHMEVSDQFRQVFKLIDTNGDGKISTIELCEMLSSLGYNKYTATKEAENMIRELDFNGDGFVDIDEFMFVMKEDNYGKGKEHDHDEYLMDAFLVFDSDKNGLISPKELRSVLINLGCDNCSLRDCKRMIKGVDKNGDGFVDFEEFRSMMN